MQFRSTDDGYGFGLGRRLADGLKDGRVSLFWASHCPRRARLHRRAPPFPYRSTRRRTICVRGPHVPSDYLFRPHLRGFTSHTIILHRAPYPPPAPARTVRLLNLVLISTEMYLPSCPFLVSLARFSFPDHGSPSSTFDLRFRPATAIRDPPHSPSHTHHPRGRIPALGSQDRGPTRPHLTPLPLPCDQPGELARLALNPSSSPAGLGRTSTGAHREGQD